MKLVIAGGRHYSLTDADRRFLRQLCLSREVTEIVSGGATGADKGGEDFAKSMGLPITVFPADWKTHGRAAGPIRNRKMAEYCDLVVLFPGGRGTESMLRQARQANKPVVLGCSWGY